jgi:hypothetical protein
LGSVIAARPLASSSSSWCDNTVLIATTSFSALQPALPLGMSLFFTMSTSVSGSAAGYVSVLHYVD